jgi:Ca-activated chloride channel family protein
MPDFAHPWALLLLLPLAGIFGWRLRRPVLVLSQVLPEGWGKEEKRPFPPLPWSFRAVGSTLLIVALADPGVSASAPLPPGEGITIMIALDLSGSMGLSDQGGRSRLEAAKREIGRFVSSRPDDLMGLVTFGEEAVTRVPPTTYHSHLLDVIGGLEVARGENGTALGTGLGLAVQRVVGVPSPSRVVVLLTDGRNNTGGMDPLAVARAAGLLEVRIHAIGLGSRTGDDPVDEAVLAEVALLSGGSSFRADDPAGFRTIMESVDALEKGTTPAEGTFQHTSFHRAFLFLGALFLVVEHLLWMTPGGRLW